MNDPYAHTKNTYLGPIARTNEPMIFAEQGSQLLYFLQLRKFSVYLGLILAILGILQVVGQ